MIAYRLFFFLILLIYYSVKSFGTTYYISTSGNDKYNGIHENSPFASIQRAADLVKAGDTVLIMEGKYTGFAIKNKHGTTANWIVFKPYSNHKIIIDLYLEKYSTYERGIDIRGCSYVEIDGFEITDSNPAYDSEMFSDYKQGDRHKAIGIWPTSKINAPAYIRIINNHIHRIGESGIYTSYISHHIEIINNHIHNVGLCKRGYGLYIGGDDHIIRHNIIHDSYGYGIHLYSEGGPAPERNLIEKNIIYNNGRMDYNKGYSGSLGKPKGDGIVVAGDGECNIICNNLCYNNLRRGLRLYDSKYAYVFNNTLYGNGLEGLFIASNQDAAIINNISFNNYGGNNSSKEIYIGVGNNLQNNLFGINPQFINPVNNDFHVQLNSPAIDMGIEIPGYNTDLEGNNRPFGEGWDIGAYEYFPKPDTVEHEKVSR